MQFDDRLATVLRHRAGGERAARTQFRQLLDLLGEPPRNHDESLEAAAYLRLDALSELVSLKDRARIVAEGASRIRNPALVAWAGEAAAEVAAAALARASLSDEEWAEIIPALPIRARGFLRHRRNLPNAAVSLLDRLGVQDRVLPEPDGAQEEPLELDPASAIDDDTIEIEEHLEDTRPLEQTKASETEPSGIGELVRRIEAFSKARSARTAETTDGSLAPRLPLGEQDSERQPPALETFDFTTDVGGRIDWADAEIASMLVGMPLVRSAHASGAATDFSAAFHNRQPVRGYPMSLSGAHRIEGRWIIDAQPKFGPRNGQFTGYVGRFRRFADDSHQLRAEAEADRIRQLLHELRTPVNAIQGFAEVIQQQLFGPTPHEYRALAASIAGDSARMLAGFDELDRLARLEGGMLDLDTGKSDFAAIALKQVEQLQGVLSPRVSRFEANWPTGEAILALEKRESEKLAWRILATLASAAGAGETIAIDLAADREELAMTCALPTSLRDAKDIFSSETRPAGGALSPGIFGAGFSLRLARAEARACGGELARLDDKLVLSLPLLTASQGEFSPENEPDRAAG